MASTIPLVAAPHAAAAATRPSRAAATAGDAAADTFDQALARSGADSAPRATSSSPQREAAAVPAEEPATGLEIAPCGVETWVAACLAFTPRLETPPAAIEPEPSPRAERAEGVDAVDGTAEVESTAASTEPPAIGLATAVDVLPVEQVDDGAAVAGDLIATVGASLAAPAPSAPQPRQAAPRAIARSLQPDSIQSSSVSANVSAPAATEAPETTPAQSPELGPSAATSTPSPALDAATEPARQAPAMPRASDSPTRIAARHMLRDALAEMPVPDRPSVTVVTPRPEAVATPALVTPPAPTNAAAQRQATSEPIGEDAQIAEWLGVGASPAAAAPQTESRGSRAGGDRSGQGQDPQPQAFWSRSAARAAATTVPASMVFPGQASVAAALEQAGPLTTGVPPSLAPHALQPVVPQVVKGLQVQLAAGGGDMTLTLAPEHLGTVTIEVKVDRQRVQATLTSDTPAVRGWIAAHEQDLKSGLAELGLHLDELVVREDSGQQSPQRDQASPERRRKQQMDEDAVFEVLV